MPVDKSAPRVRQMFAEIATRYDLLNHLLSLNVDRYWRRQLVRRVPVPNGGEVLDVCTGTGDLALAYWQSAPVASQIVGADFCHEMLTIGRRKGIAAGAANRLRFVEADAMKLPLPAERFDVVTVAFGLRNVSDAAVGLAEMVRVCVPGGKVAVLEFSTPQRQPFKAGYQWYFRHVLPRIGQLVARNRHSAYNYLPQSVGEFPQGDALVQLMRAAGLVDVAWRPLTLGVASLYVGVKENSPLASRNE